MSESVVCPGCRRRVRVPDGADPARCRCPKCRTRLRPAADDAYQVFATTVAPDPPADAPLSLDECEPITAARAAVELPPPYRVPARVVGRHPLRGPVTAVLTPFGLFIEREPNRPLAFAPVGCRAAADGDALRVEIPGGPLQIVLPSARLAVDAAAFLAGRRPVPGPAEYAAPGRFFPVWLVAVLVLAAAAFAGGAAAYLALRPPAVVEQPPPPPPPPIEPPVEPPPPPPEPEGPPTHLDLAAREGMTRLADGPDAVTALAVTPDGAETVVGYADGTTWAWRLDQPAFEPPRVGPRGVGPVRRIEFGPAGDVAYLSGDSGLSVALFRAPRAAVHVSGRLAVAIPESGRERFAAIRADKLVTRLVPMALVKDPPSARVVGGVVTTTPKDEVQVAGPKGDVSVPGVTFIAWHPAGRLVYGLPDGSITSFPAGPKAVPLSRLHKAPVKAWAVGPTWPDFATGDEKGVVGVWPNKALAPYPLNVGAVAVRHLAFSPCGGELAVADEAGAVSVWNLPTMTKVFGVTRPPPAVVAYGPRADLLLLSDGKGVEVWSLPSLAEQAGKTWP